ncbi:energy transducer TonB [Seleniivibrio woodruffii]|uniref:energy transducer TonB n=1 Tax=Seleniivibrio woodruffii TaxID=1078050 RepID=UPI0026EE0265|nr:energy transducer TonB [Seleniivibrio woodruffii]
MNYFKGFFVSFVLHALVILALFAGRANMKAVADEPETIDISTYTVAKAEPVKTETPALPAPKKEPVKSAPVKPVAAPPVSAPPMVAKEPVKATEPKVVSDFGQKEYVPVSVPDAQKLPAYSGEGTVGAKEEPAQGTGIKQAGAQNTSNTDSAAATAEYMRINLSGIRKKIYDKLSYPSSARRMGMRGAASIKFRIHENGTVDNATVHKSSGFDVLDEAAKQAVLDAAPLPSPSETVNVVLSVNFALR